MLLLKQSKAYFHLQMKVIEREPSRPQSWRIAERFAPKITTEPSSSGKETLRERNSCGKVVLFQRGGMKGENRCGKGHSVLKTRIKKKVFPNEESHRVRGAEEEGGKLLQIGIAKIGGRGAR